MLCVVCHAICLLGQVCCSMQAECCLPCIVPARMNCRSIALHAPPQHLRLLLCNDEQGALQCRRCMAIWQWAGNSCSNVCPVVRCKRAPKASGLGSTVATCWSTCQSAVDGEFALTKACCV